MLESRSHNREVQGSYPVGITSRTYADEGKYPLTLTLDLLAISKYPIYLTGEPFNNISLYFTR